ncbi:MAG TPA: hypothetical protein VF116_00765 [Ktedonobacterales bacterium]
MMRKDTLGTDERPHYYSKFWIEVALGQAGIAPQHAVETVEPEAEFDEYEEPEPELELPKPAPKPAAKPKVEKKAESRPVLTSLADLANIDKLMQDSAAMDSAEVPDIEGGAIEDFAPFTTTAEPAEEYAGQAGEAPADEAEEDLGDFYDEDEEEDEWGGGGGTGGRRPKRPQQRPPKRERRPY